MKKAEMGFGFVELMVSMLLIAWGVALLGKTLHQTALALSGYRVASRAMGVLHRQMVSLRLAGGAGGGWAPGEHRLSVEEYTVIWTVGEGPGNCLGCGLVVVHPSGLRRERRFWHVPLPEGV